MKGFKWVAECSPQKCGKEFMVPGKLRDNCPDSKHSYGKISLNGRNLIWPHVTWTFEHQEGVGPHHPHLGGFASNDFWRRRHPTHQRRKLQLVACYTLLGTNISLSKAVLKMSFLFPRWDMLIPWRVSIYSRPLYLFLFISTYIIYVCVRALYDT